jgi:hypothetical protein
MYRRVEARTGEANPVRAFLCALVASRFWGGRAPFFTRDSFQPLTHS